MGVTTAAVIHQPSYQVFAMFDDVLLLCKGGRTVYAGPECEVQGYFEGLGYALPGKQNPADFYMDITAGIVPIPGQEATSAQVNSFVGPHLPLSGSMVQHLVSAWSSQKVRQTNVQGQHLHPMEDPWRTPQHSFAWLSRLA